MSRVIKKIELDFKKTSFYFIDHVQCGKTLSKKIIERIDLCQGSFYTLLPSNAELNRLYEFSYGGIIPSISYDNQKYKIEGVSDNFLPQQVITLSHECSDYISFYTRAKEKNCAIIENYMLEPDSPYVNIENVKIISYNKEVYYFLDKKNSAAEIYKTIRKSTQVWHFVSLLTEVKDSISTFTNRTLDQVCDTAKFVIAGAYDGEGYIFWEKMVVE